MTAPAEAMIEAVIFDYGGVISAPLLQGLSRFEQEMGYPPGSLRMLMFGEGPDQETGDAVNNEPHDYYFLETGDMSLHDYLTRLKERAPAILGRPIDFAEYSAFVRTAPMGVQWPVIHRIRRLLTDGMRLALLTNNVKELGNAWRSTFPVDELFAVIVDSSEVGMRKPDPRIYEHTCARIGVAPTAAVFLDDNVANVTAAQALGMETVHVGTEPLATIAELDAILERRGVAAAR